MAYPGLSLYHATKWGVEGFFEAVAPEIEPFGIEVTVVQPGSVRTQFGGSSAVFGGPSMSFYGPDSPGGSLRARLEKGNSSDAGPGDVRKVAEAIVRSVDLSPAPRRLFLGSDAYAAEEALLGRLHALRAQRETAFSTDG